jgi:NADH:ubiquinone oxidoreductase subunit 2 (subunit N)
MSVKNLILIPEMILGISILYLILHGTFISTKKEYPLIHDSILNIGILILISTFFLVVHDPISSIIDMTCFNNSIANDYLGNSSKFIIVGFSLFCLLMIQQYLTEQKINHFEYILLFLFALLGLLLLCCANDLITAYLAIELQSLAFYAMAAFKRNSTFSIDAGLKYFILGSFSSGLLLFGSSLIYGLTGTVNFEDLKDLFSNIFPGNTTFDFTTTSSIVFDTQALDFLQKLPQQQILNKGVYTLTSMEYSSLVKLLNEIDNVRLADYQESFLFNKSFDTSLIQFSVILVLISLFFKLALAPFHVWLPDVYEGSPLSSTMFFAIIPKIGVLTLLVRIVYHGFYGFLDYWQQYLVLVAVLSVLVGSVTALEQRKLKSLLAYSSIGHVGYLLVSYSTGTLDGLQMLFFYIIVYMLAGLCLWSILILMKKKYNYSVKSSKDLGDLSLLLKSNNTLAFIFCIVFFSIAGVPPLIGFLAKAGIFLVAIESSMYFVAFISILCSVISTFYYLRVIKVILFEQKLVGSLYYPLETQKASVITVIFFLVIFLFINPTLLYLISYKISLLGYI